MPRRKLLLLDLAYHEHSGSTVFMLELLGRRFDVTRVYTDVGRDDIEAYRALIAEHKPDILFFLQVYCNADIMAELGLPGIWMPMYDNVNKRFDNRFVDAARVGQAMAAFSRAHGEFAEFWDLPNIVLQYFPEPSPAPDFEVGNDRALIWYRGGVMPAEAAPALLGIPNLKVVIKHDPDPYYINAKRDDGELAPYIERVVEGFLPKEEYNALVASCGIYVAPRKAEGIGLSFLEAMARGACVVAYDAPTMNEYIEHGKNGWLFGSGNSEQLSAGKVVAIRRAAHESVVQGRDRWKSQEGQFLDFIDSAPPMVWRKGRVKLGLVRALKRVKYAFGR